MSDDYLLRPLDTAPAYAAVVDRVRRAVALGVLLPGERLPAERALAEGLGVSRVTVREALRVLQGEGLLITRRGGTVVSPTAAALESVQDDEEYGRRIGDVFELRLAVEAMGAALAAERASPADVTWLDGCQAELTRSGDVHEFRRADSGFHLAVARMSGNALLVEVVEDLRAAAFSRTDRDDLALIHESSVRGHAAVIAAIRDRDPGAASTAMTAHLQEARAEIDAVLVERRRSAR
ncbi:FadR/GntR family transcriptional regulator [Mycobacterium sp. WMMD1722]|uniref:FadR/GntR family transcriptional regulator n=1 Tax=Mycobacterium sp. WMMD1722 TaxID=3404117 RepID=UPI003BF55D1F